MAHRSEDCQRLEAEFHTPDSLSCLSSLEKNRAPTVSLFVLPPDVTSRPHTKDDKPFERIAAYCQELGDEDVICVLTSPADAARLLPALETALHFQLWIAVKSADDNAPTDGLPERHTALLVLTRYRTPLRHTKTRIQYTYCPACGKTTKDYGGKKHVYHEYGTLMADVWRDIPCSLSGDIGPVVDRLQDVFGLSPYTALQVFDLRSCRDFKGDAVARVREGSLPMEWGETSLPQDSRLINDDCLTALATIPDNSVDFCFADPPYNLKKKYDHWNDGLESRAYFDWCDQWLSELARVLKPGRTLAVMNIPLWTVRHFQHLDSFLEFQRWIAWEALSFPVRMIMPAHYAIVCFTKGAARLLPGLQASELSALDKEALSPLAEFYCLRAGCIAQRPRNGINDTGEVSDLWHDVHRLKHNSRRVDHPCQLPPLLMRRLYALFTQPGETVLDCFNGSGTSTLTAHQMGRRFIGIELSAQYHQLAEARHGLIATGADPFAKQDDNIPKAKNSPVERLPKQQYAVSKKVLQLEVRRIAHLLGRLPNREEVRDMSAYPLEYYERYFHSWGEVCAAARTTGMSELPPDMLKAEPQMSLTFEG